MFPGELRKNILEIFKSIELIHKENSSHQGIVILQQQAPGVVTSIYFVKIKTFL